MLLDFNFLNHHPTARNFKKSFRTDSAGCTGGGSLDTLHDIPDNIPGPARTQGAQQLQVHTINVYISRFHKTGGGVKVERTPI